jgi:Na+/H+ antiporter NhaC
MIFIQTIPFNLYALLTIAMVFTLCYLNLDFGKMKKNEMIAATTGDLDAGEVDKSEEEAALAANPNGKVRHLVVPVIILIACCIGSMIYSGYFYDWDTGLYGTTPMSSSVIEAFSNCDAGSSLAIGSTIALIIIAIYYMIDNVLSFKEITDSFTQGFKAMVPAILILTFAWTLSAVMGAKGGGLDAQAFVQANIEKIPEAITMLFPAIFFILACVIAFSTGTSWGTFGVLVPIAVTILGGQADTLTILTISATLGGAVYGDHISPISDTTILASAGGNCNHVDHVKTQLPYASLVMVISFLSYVVGGVCATLGSVLCAVIMWVVAILLFVGAIFGLKYLNKKNAAKTEQ